VRIGRGHGLAVPRPAAAPDRAVGAVPADTRGKDAPVDGGEDPAEELADLDVPDDPNE
jgi:hypothetical protein